MPLFDENGKMVKIDKANPDNDFPTMKDLNEAPRIERKKLFALPDNISMTTIVLAGVVVVFLIVVTVLALKISSLSEKVTALSEANLQIEATQTKQDDLEKRVRKLEGATKRKPQPVAESKKPDGQKKKQVR
jgi:cell division protein FtsL